MFTWEYIFLCVNPFIHTFASFNEFLSMDLKHFEKISKALGDVSRLKILEDMSDNGGSMQCAEIVKVLGLAQPSVSHHIKTLIEAGLIEPEKNGRNYTYQLNRPLLNAFAKKLTSIAGCFAIFAI